MKQRKYIERAVSKHFKVDISKVYTARKSVYPYNGAKLALMYLLYKNGYKSYDIAKWFGFNPTLVYRYCGVVNVALKSDTKIKEDIESIEKLLTSKNQ